MRSDVKYILTTELTALKDKIIANHIKAGQKASGKTASSFKVVIVGDSATLFARKAIGTLETGRKGGKVPKGFYHIIKQWAIDKQLSVDNVSTFAYFVSKKIAESGTDLFRRGGRNDIYSKEIKTAVTIIKSKLTERFSKETINIKIN